MHNVCEMLYLNLLMPTLMYLFCDDYHVRYPSSQYKNQTENGDNKLFKYIKQ